MESEAAAPAATGGEVSTGLDLQAMLDGVAPSTPESSTPAEPAPTPEGQEPQEPVEAKSEEPVEAKSEEDKPADQTAEEFSEPLPGKLGKLLETLGKDQKTADLARQLRADHEALNGPEGFRAIFPKLEEAVEYRRVAPTIDDLKVMQDYTGRYQKLDGEYVNDPKALLDTLSTDVHGNVAPEFRRFTEVIEPKLKEIAERTGDTSIYLNVGKPFVNEYRRGFLDWVKSQGTPEEIETIGIADQKFAGHLTDDRPAQASRFQGTPEWQELQQLRAERANLQGQTGQSFFQDVNRDITPSLRTEVRKYLDEKAGAGLPEGVRSEVLDEMAESISNQIFKEINDNPLVRSELARMIEGGDYSLNHKAQVIERVMTRARAYLPTKSAPEIRRMSDRMRKLTGGNGNAGKQTTTTARSKDVGSGSPTVGTGKTGPMPKGAPAGFNNMSQDDKAKFVNWRAMGEDADQIFIEAQMSGDWSKVVMKGH